ncbi:MAG: hypothetical protein HC841_05150 [Verrucomicrobiae bacterium]|nr:hypothetical protein [Verrucomicrobiae bacterium]
MSGVEFVRRYLLHVLPRGLRAIRRFGFCHPAAKRTRERIAFHTGVPLLLGPELPPPTKAPPACPRCGNALVRVGSFLPFWKTGRAPPRPGKTPRATPCRR